MSTAAVEFRHERLLAAGLFAVLVIALAAIGGFTTVSGPVVALYFLFLLVWSAFEDEHEYRHGLAWGLGFLLCGAVLVARGEVNVLTAIFPFVGTAIISQHAYQLVGR